MAAHHQLPSLPGGSYDDQYLSRAEADELFDQVTGLFAKKEGSQKLTYGITGYAGPQLVIFGHTGANPDTLKLPPFLRALVERIKGETLGHLPFQVTVNLYKDSKKELIPHKDGVGDQVIIVTLGSHTVLEFGYFPIDPAEKGTRVFPLMFNEQPAGERSASEEAERSETSMWVPVYRTDELQRVWVRHGSLLRLTGSSYKEWAHGVKSAESDVFNPNELINASSLTDLVEGQIVPRGARVSIVLWSKSQPLQE